MKTFKQYSNMALFSALFMMTFFMGGCGGSSSCDDTSRPATVLEGTPPTVILTDPEDNATDVPSNRTISALISEELDRSTVTNTTFTLSSANGSVSGDVYYFNKTMFFNPHVNLTANTNYIATITTGIKDLDGYSMVEDYVWSFTTGDINTIAPYVTSTDPIDNAIDVVLNKTISALLNEEADPRTVNTDTFTLTLATDTVKIPGVVTYLNKRMYFKPTSPLAPDTEYNATVTTGVTDLDDNNLDIINGLNTWIFKTGTIVSEGPDPVNLGSAEDFAILTKSGISTTGNTLITGDIGVSPIDDTAITGFSLIRDSTNTFSTSIYVVGSVYAANMATPTPAKMTTAVSAMEAAYTDAAGRTNPDATELGAGNISGLTIAPGLYKWGTGVLITDAGVTLSGGANDVWIFQISGDLTVMSDAIVTLEGGAQAKNIFWQVAGGTGVVLGTGSDFKGVVLAQTKIVLDTGATVVEGRLLAQTAVTLDANTVTEPTE